MQIVICDQKSKGRLTGYNKATINAWSATFSHERRRARTALENCKQKQKGQVLPYNKPASQYDYRRPLCFDDLNTDGSQTLCDHMASNEKMREADICRYLPPLGMFPCEVSAREGKLIQYYMNVMSAEMCGIAPKGPNFDPFCDGHFQICLQHPVLFRITILGISAGHGALTKGAFKGDLDYHQYQSLREMRKYFNNHKNACSDLSIAICLYRALLDSCLRSDGAPLTHLRAALHMVEMRGGYKALIHNEPLLIVLMTSRWRFARDRFASASKSRSEASSQITEPSLIPENGCRYLRFLAEAQDLADIHRSLDCDILPLRNTIFTQSDYIREMLWPKNNNIHLFQWQDVDRMSLLIVLISLNRALLDFQDDHRLTNLFLEDFQDRMLRLKSDGHQFVIVVARTLMRSSSCEELNLTHWERFLFATQMLEWVVQFGDLYQSEIVRRLSLNLIGVVESACGDEN